MHISFYLFLFFGFLSSLSASFNAYVTNLSGSDVSQIILDPATGNPSLGGTTPDSGNTPESLVVAPNQQYLYVGTESGTIEQFHINQITGAPTFVTSIAHSGSAFLSMAIAPNGKNLYALDTNNNQIFQVALDPTTGNPSFILPATGAGSGSFSLAMTPDGNFLYVVHSSNLMTQISISNTGGLTPTGASASSGNSRIAIAPNGNNAYSTQFSLNEVVQTRLNPFSSTGNTAPTQMNPSAITFAPDGKNVYVSNESGDSVTQISINQGTGAPSAGVTTSSGGTLANGLAVAPDQKNLYVVNSVTNNIVQIALGSNGAPSMTSFFSSTGGFGPVAIGIVTLPSLAPPSGRQKKNRFLMQTDIYNSIAWEGLPFTVFYKIYRDAAQTHLVATVPAVGLFLEFDDHNRKKGVIYTYYIVAFDANSIPTDLGSVTVDPI
jgi:DNA-binding beta-propeller fold protein YncE